MNPDEIEVGKEYVYLSQFVRVNEVGCVFDGDAECLIETRFAEYSKCMASELSPKERK